MEKIAYANTHTQNTLQMHKNLIYMVLHLLFTWKCSNKVFSTNFMDKLEKLSISSVSPYKLESHAQELQPIRKHLCKRHSSTLRF